MVRHHLPIQQKTWSHVLEECLCNGPAHNATAAEEDQPLHVCKVVKLSQIYFTYMQLSMSAGVCGKTERSVGLTASDNFC